MEFPCQRVIWYVLPSIRVAIAVELQKSGKSQKEISKILNVRPSTISQYLSGKRGLKIVFVGDVKILIEQIVNDINNGKQIDIGKRVCDVCRLLHELNDNNCGI